MMPTSTFKKRGKEVVAILRAKRQAMAGMVRQALLDADRDLSGSRRNPLTEHTNAELRHEAQLMEEVLRLLAQHGELPKWVRIEHREIQERERFAVVCGEGE